METNFVTILIAMLGSSVLTALVTVMAKRQSDQAVINDTLLENARKDISQIRTDNAELRARIEELEKQIGKLKQDLEERELLVRIAEKEKEALKEKVECLEKQLGKGIK